MLYAHMELSKVKENTFKGNKKAEGIRKNILRIWFNKNNMETISHEKLVDKYIGKKGTLIGWLMSKNYKWMSSLIK